jgi:hypothetical protein
MNMSTAKRDLTHLHIHRCELIKVHVTVWVLYMLRPFVAVGLTKGLMLTIKLREARVIFPSLLNGVSELYQASVSLGISLIEPFPMIVIV